MARNLFSSDVFPGSLVEPFEITSEATGSYNCVAWALGDEARFWWPGPEEFFYWPPGLPRTDTVEVFAQMFALHGFEICPDGSPETGFCKVALFAKDGVPAHAARQLADGSWTSKLGALEDVRHTLESISGGLYGSVVLFFRRIT